MGKDRLFRSKLKRAYGKPELHQCAVSLKHSLFVRVEKDTLPAGPRRESSYSRRRLEQNVHTGHNRP